MKSLHKKLDNETKVRTNLFVPIVNMVHYTIRDIIRKHTTSYQSNSVNIKVKITTKVKVQVINEINKQII